MKSHVDGRGVVDVSDILLLLASWGACEGCSVDIEGSVIVDIGDILAVLVAWGPCP